MSEPASRQATAFVFDLDGTLVDSAYQHVLSQGNQGAQGEQIVSQISRTSL